MSTERPILLFPSQMADLVVLGFDLSQEERDTLVIGELSKYGYRIMLTPPVPSAAGYSQIDATIARLGSRNLFAQIPYRTLARLQGRAAR